MAEVADRVVAAEQRIGRWRRRTVLLAVASVALIGAGTIWAMTRDSGPYTPPLEHGDGAGPMRCPTVASRAVPDTFGGGGDILTYVDGAKCQAVLSIKNPTDEPVTVLSVATTDEGFVEPIRLVSATRAKQQVSRRTKCFGCARQFVDFSPMTIAPGGEWEIAVQGVMSNCRPARKGGGYTERVRESLEFQVEVAGETRPVTLFLDQPWAVRSAGCSSKY